MEKVKSNLWLFPTKIMVHIHDRSPSKRYTYLKVILLVANDEARINFLVDLLSQDVHHRVFVASNAFSAIKFLRYIIPHLVIVDDCLTVMTGIQLYDYLYANRMLADLPVIMLSVSLEEVRDELEAGQLIWLNIPFDLNKFIATIETIFAAPSSE
jgi:DNA-binding response OmpR family regulator